MEAEEPSLFHVLKTRRRRKNRLIWQIQDSNGTIYTRYQDIARTFVKHLDHKFGPIAVVTQSLTILLNHVPPACPTTYVEHLEQTITLDEVLSALPAGAHHKAPGIDGMCLELYHAIWETIHAILHSPSQPHVPPQTHILSPEARNTCLSPKTQR
jgi:hypothetical protein